MFRVIAQTEHEFVSSAQSTIVVRKIDLKICTFLTEEDAYLPFDRKKVRAISNFEIRGLKAHAGWQTYIINPFHIFLKQTI